MIWPKEEMTIACSSWGMMDDRDVPPRPVQSLSCSPSAQGWISKEESRNLCSPSFFRPRRQLKLNSHSMMVTQGMMRQEERLKRQRATRNLPSARGPLLKCIGALPRFLHPFIIIPAAIRGGGVSADDLLC